tara:strand:+ start:90 stop:965 length:876 start_codon:yes stop_codon:yes gene_type:complete
MEWILSIRSPQLTTFFQYITWLGYRDFLFLFIPFCYWFLDRKVFGIFPLFVFISALINAYLKELFHDPRPDSVFNIDPWLDPLDPSFGFPSGHAQLAIVIWGFLMLRSQNTWIRSIFIFLILTVSFSRLYLGVHDVIDIIGGAIIGLISLLLLEQLLSEKGKWIRDLSSVKHFTIYIFFLILLMFLWPTQDGKIIVTGLGALIIGFWLGNKLNDAFAQYERPANIFLKLLSSLFAVIGFIILNDKLEHLFQLIQFSDHLETGISSLILGIYISFIAPTILFYLRLQTKTKN